MRAVRLIAAERLGAEVVVRPGFGGAFWAEILAPQGARADGRPVLAYASGATEADAARALDELVATGDREKPCAVCAGPGVESRERPFVMVDGWSVGSRRVFRGGHLCAVCARGASSIGGEG